jgi:hypothetical protein
LCGDYFENGQGRRQAVQTADPDATPRAEKARLKIGNCKFSIFNPSLKTPMNKFYLWLDDLKTGPYSLHQVWHLLDIGKITGDTLCCQDGGPDEWTAIKGCAAFSAGRTMRAEAAGSPAFSRARSALAGRELAS